MAKKTEKSQVRLDEIDRKILRSLQEDGRLTIVQLADKVGLSASPCHRRVQLMEATGVIERYVAVVDQKAVGLPVSVFVSIRLESQKEEALQKFARAIAPWREIQECYLMTGPRDYLMRVVVADVAAYEKFLKTKLTRLSGVTSMESSFALEQVKYTHQLPLEDAGRFSN